MGGPGAVSTHRALRGFGDAQHRAWTNSPLRGIHPTIAAELDNVEATNRLVQHGGGVALVFLPSVSREIADNRLVMLPMVSGSVSVGIDLVVRSDSEAPAAAQAFISLVEEMVA